jgi:hypothetical protein
VMAIVLFGLVALIERRVVRWDRGEVTRA